MDARYRTQRRRDNGFCEASAGPETTCYLSSCHVNGAFKNVMNRIKHKRDTEIVVPGIGGGRLSIDPETDLFDSFTFFFFCRLSDAFHPKRVISKQVEGSGATYRLG